MKLTELGHDVLLEICAQVFEGAYNLCSFNFNSSEFDHACRRILQIIQENGLSSRISRRLSSIFPGRMDQDPVSFPVLLLKFSWT